MLNSFKKPRRNASAAKQQKINVAKKLAARPESPPSSDTESDSDSDSEYEEILISSIGGKPKRPDPFLSRQAPQDNKISQKPEPPSTARTEPNHANHFQEEPLVGDKNLQTSVPAEPTLSQTSVPAPSNVVRTKPSKRKKIVIKKYYQRKVPEPHAPHVSSAKHALPEPSLAAQEPRRSYIGISNHKGSHTPRTNPHSTMSSRILNW